MIETIRFLLSTVVLEAHIWPLNVPWLAWQSVFAFYTLSGYLMTRVLNERYGFLWSGTAAFAVNRILRLWPAYLVIAALSYVTLRLNLMSPTYGLLRLPSTAIEKITNITVLGQVTFDYQFMGHLSVLVPNGWSLSIELFCYSLLALYFAKTPLRLCWLAGAGAIALTLSTAYCSITPGDYGPYCFQNRYGVLQAGFIPFALGGLIFFRGDRLKAAVDRWILLIAGAVLASLFAIYSVPPLQWTVAPFVGALGMGVLLIYSFGRDFHNAVTEFLGRASYHLFISHWVLAAILIRLGGVRPGSFRLMLYTLALALLLSCVLVPMEHRIERLRRRIAERAAAETQLARP